MLLETGGGIRNIASFIGDDPLLVYNGDILTDIDIGKLIAQHQASGNIATLALRSSGQNCNVNIEGDQVTDMRNTLGDTPGTHQFTGIYCIEPEILELIPDEEVTSIVPAFIKLIEQQKLGAVVLDEGDWHDIGNVQTYRTIHRQMRAQSTIRSTRKRSLIPAPTSTAPVLSGPEPSSRQAHAWKTPSSGQVSRYAKTPSSRDILLRIHPPSADGVEVAGAA